MTDAVMNAHRAGQTGGRSQILLASFFFSFTLALGAPLHIYLSNRLEFPFSTWEMVVAVLPIFLGLLLITSCLLGLLQGVRRRRGVATVFVLSMLLWLQGNVLVWNYGALDGRDIEWNGLWAYGAADGLVWVVGIALALSRAEWLLRHVVTSLSLVFVAIQCLTLSLLFANSPPLGDYRLDSRGKYTFSSRENVIVLVLDAFQTDVFQELIEEDPSISSVFDGFVYFRNAVSGYRQSHPSIANILTATYFDNSVPMWDYTREAYLSDSSLPKFLVAHDYRVDVFEQEVGLFLDPSVISNVRRENVSPSSQALLGVMYVLDVALFRYLPHYLKKYVHNDQLWLLSRWHENATDFSDAGSHGSDDAQHSRMDLFTTEARSKLSNVRFAHQFVQSSEVGYNQKAFKFYHIYGTHLPLRMTRDYEYRELERTRDSLKEVAAGVVGLVRIMFDRLKDLGIFHDSLIFVIADHGMWSSVAKVRIPEDITMKYGTDAPVDRSQLPEQKGTALPLILVKRPRRSESLLVSDAPVALADIPKTIVSELGYAGGSFPGESMFEVAADSRRVRKVLFSTFRENPAYSEPYRSTMHEYLVSGFSWLDSSWEKTGKIYPPGPLDPSAGRHPQN